MDINGIQKLTLLDFPGHCACTVFLAGCNLRCPFCHNSSLVLEKGECVMTEEKFFSFLSTREGLLDGVCITGGEPLLRKDIKEFIRKIKDAGFKAKLDTNGFFPDVLEEILAEGLVSYVAVDIKNSLPEYSRTCGVNVDTDKIKRTVAMLVSSDIDYEFRTTVVKELHTKEDIAAIGAWIAGAEKYFLQQFVDSGDLICLGLSAESEENVREMQEIASRFVKKTDIRGF